MKRNKVLQKFVDDFAEKNLHTSLSSAQERKICVACGRKISGFRDSLSEREYEKSGLCQQCQDEVFGV